MRSAKTVMELLEIERGTSLIDLLSAEFVEVERMVDGRLWINVDGICLVRIKTVGEIRTKGLKNMNPKQE